MLRVSTRLPEDVETLVHRTIGCCIEVHRALGPGLLEHIYARAMSLELHEMSIAFEAEKEFAVSYRDQLLCHQRVDLVVGGQIVVELKAVDRLNPVHHAQMLSYLRVAKLRIGLLVNFNVPVLPDGLKRIVL